MNFIIEILPKKENANEFCFVVRNQQGFPISVCDSIDDASDVIKEKFDELLSKRSSNS